MTTVLVATELLPDWMNTAANYNPVDLQRSQAAKC